MKVKFKFLIGQTQYIAVAQDVCLFRFKLCAVEVGAVLRMIVDDKIDISLGENVAMSASDLQQRRQVIIDRACFRIAPDPEIRFMQFDAFAVGAAQEIRV